MKAAKILVDSAERNAPRESGDLSEDIHRQTKQSDGALTVRVGPSRETFYGLIQEFGSLEANIPAQHWLENSARAVQDEVLEEFYSGLTEGLNDMKKGGK
jgi:HK97 gp10 family phage protein